MKKYSAPSRSCPIISIYSDNDLSEDGFILDDSKSTDVRPHSEEIFNLDWNELPLAVLEDGKGG